ncbi:hypothetical protein BC827DRAFT_1151558 [Russula dissimulans]|nr:hypothetical protein BC827DRAFT_1151558 [Russula dissimulans]
MCPNKPGALSLVFSNWCSHPQLHTPTPSTPSPFPPAPFTSFRNRQKPTTKIIQKCHSGSGVDAVPSIGDNNTTTWCGWGAPAPSGSSQVTNIPPRRDFSGNSEGGVRKQGVGKEGRSRRKEETKTKEGPLAYHPPIPRAPVVRQAFLWRARVRKPVKCVQNPGRRPGILARPNLNLLRSTSVVHVVVVLDRGKGTFGGEGRRWMTV